MVTLVLVAFAVLATAPAADAAARKHVVKLNSVLFVAQVGSTPGGASVFAGSVVDPKLHHGAIVYGVFPITPVKAEVTLQEFFALGSIRGRGNVTLVPGAGTQMTVSGSFKVTGGTGTYRKAHGTLTARGVINSDSTSMITEKGSLSY